MRSWRRLRFLLLTTALGTGCLAGESDDGTIAKDTAAGIPGDVAVLSDAVLLEPGGPPDFGATEDCATGASDIAPLADAAVTADASYGEASLDLDTTAPEDAWVADDADIGDLNVPNAELPVTSGCGSSEACPDGHACLDEGNGPTCVAVDQCSKDGAFLLHDVLGALMNQGSLYVKLEVRVWSGAPTCTILGCAKDSPCCNTCFAQLFIGKAEFPIVLQGQGQAIGCKGSECDVANLCGPVVPEKWYWIWGTLELLGSLPQFRVDGFCLVME